MIGWLWMHPSVKHENGVDVLEPGEVSTTCGNCRRYVSVRCRDIAAGDGVFICPSCGEHTPVDDRPRISLLAVFMAEERAIEAELRTINNVQHTGEYE